MAGSRVTAALPPPSITPVTYVALVLVFHLLYLVLPLSAIAYPAYTLSTMLRGVASPSAPYILGAAGAYFSTWIIFSSHSKRGAPVDFLNTNPLNHFILRCMNVSIIATEKMPASPSTNLIFACHPHGALAFNRAAVGFEMKHLWLKATGIKNLRVLAATAAFYVPLIREMWIWSYCIEASKKVAVRALSKLNPDHTLEDRVALFVYPGGEKEQLMTVRGKETVYLQNRKGFIKLALEQGLEVVPVYAFGESDLYTHHSFLLGFREWLVSAAGAAVPLISGQLGLLPYFPRSGITLVMGGGIGIEAPKDRGNVTKEELDRAHALYVRKLKELFDREKGALGYGDRELKIV
ncbi:hypothetical protein TeGR_g11776 [Tetraparma gracilis]|uniref:Acyltransferase n=1 Tax=Tetraparma gracilis TaxID=2962635 RepID=A0ABQ6MRP7_9STRA|nr:hypothetical protein TeGR_g11776 [Tetraparma gracilis]